MIVPPPRSTIRGAIAAVSRNGALTLTANVSSKAASGSSCVGPPGKTPALLTRMSTSAARSASARTSSGDLRSARTTSASPPSASIAATTSAPRASLRPLISTCAPSRASASAVARPMPEVPPVTNARCPLNSCIRCSPVAVSGHPCRTGGGDHRHPCGMDGGDHLSVVASAPGRAWRWRWISAPCGDRTQCLERLVSRGKPRIGGCLEQRLTQLVDGPPEVQRAAQVRLELLVVPGGGEHRHHHQAAGLQLETGPVPDATPDVLDGGLEGRPQKRIASAGCRRLAARCTEHLLTDLWAARPCVLCRGVHGSFSFHWTDHWRTEYWTERSKHN